MEKAELDPVVTLTDERPVVEPGSEVMTVVRIRNTSDIVEEYDLSVLGEAAAYTEVIPAQVSVYVGDVAEATVIFRPPYDSLITSGQIPFAIRAQSREDDDRTEIAEGELTLGAINLLAAKVLPARAAGRWRAKARVEMHNRGTEDLVVRLRTLDPDEKLSFALSPREIEVPPDGTAEAFLKIRPRKSMIVGSSTHLPYQVSYRRKAGVRDVYLGATSGGETEAFVDATFEQKPIVAKWMMAAFALLLLIGGLVIFRAQTADIEAVVANPVAAPLPPTEFAVTPGVDQLTITWEPPPNPPSGYQIISADPVLYAAGRFDPIPEADLEELGAQDRAFPLAVEGGTTKCLFIQSVFDDPDSGQTTQSVIVGVASPGGLLTSDLPAGNCVTAQLPDQCDAPVIGDITASPDDGTVWTVNWTYGEGCSTADQAIWTISVNGVPQQTFDDPETIAANVSLPLEDAVNGEFVISVSPGEALPGRTETVTRAEVADAIQAIEDREEAENADGRAPVGAFAIVYSYFPSEQLPLTGEGLTLAGLLEQIRNVLIDPGIPPVVDRANIYFGPVKETPEAPPSMELIRLPGALDSDFYLIVDRFDSRGAAVELCDTVNGLLEGIESDFDEAFPIGVPPEKCRAFGPLS